METYVNTKIYSWMYIAALFLTALKETVQISFNMEKKWIPFSNEKVEYYPATHKEQSTDIFNNIDESEIHYTINGKKTASKTPTLWFYLSDIMEKVKW